MSEKQNFLQKLFRGDKITYNRNEAPVPQKIEKPIVTSPRDQFMNSKPSTPQTIGVQSFPKPEPKEEEPKESRIKKAVAINETGGLGVSPDGVLTSPDDMVKGTKYIYATDEQRYSYRRPAPVENSPDNEALGMYQVTSDELATRSDDYLGRDVSPDEFSSSPELQEKYVIGRFLDLLNQKYTPEQIADIHRRGFKNSSDPGSDVYQDQEYVEKFVKNYYPSLAEFAKNINL